MTLIHILNTQPAGHIQPAIGPKLSHGAIPETARDQSVLSQPTQAYPVSCEYQAMAHQLPKGKQNPDTAHDGLEFDTPVLDSKIKNKLEMSLFSTKCLFEE